MERRGGRRDACFRAWARGASRLSAVKCRDPDEHPLELPQFPPGNQDRWRGTGILGIDHSAISVSDVEASRSFCEKQGLSVRHPMLTSGSTQVALDGLPNVEVGVVLMMPRADGARLELLAYRTPTGLPAGQLKANDVAATQIVGRQIDAVILTVIATY